MLCLERWEESRSVETVELTGEDILGRRSSVGHVMETGRCGREPQAGPAGWDAREWKEVRHRGLEKQEGP